MDYKRDSAPSRDLFFITLRLFIHQMLFRVEKYHQKGNLVSLYVIYLGT
jgi:hypothetical protein